MAKTTSEPRKSRATAGQTQREAAESLGVSLRTWEEWESGRNPMPGAMLLLYRHLAGIERIPFKSYTRRETT